MRESHSTPSSQKSRPYAPKGASQLDYKNTFARNLSSSTENTFPANKVRFVTPVGTYSASGFTTELGRGEFGRVLEVSNLTFTYTDKNGEMQTKEIKEALALKIHERYWVEEFSNKADPDQAKLQAFHIIQQQHAEADIANRNRPYAPSFAHAIVQEIGEGNNVGKFKTTLKTYSLIPRYSGEDLSKRLKNATLNPLQRLRAAVSLLESIKAMHDEGIVHHDLKPANIILSDQEDANITDFGLSYYSKLKEETKLSNGGTPNYLPPEAMIDYFKNGQFEPYHTPQSDMNAIGIVLTELLSPWSKNKEIHADRKAARKIAENKKDDASYERYKKSKINRNYALEQFSAFSNNEKYEIMLALDRLTAENPESRPKSLDGTLQLFQSMEERYMEKTRGEIGLQYLKLYKPLVNSMKSLKFNIDQLKDSDPKKDNLNRYFKELEIKKDILYTYCYQKGGKELSANHLNLIEGQIDTIVLSAFEKKSLTNNENIQAEKNRPSPTSTEEIKRASDLNSLEKIAMTQQLLEKLIDQGAGDEIIQFDNASIQKKDGQFFVEIQATTIKEALTEEGKKHIKVLSNKKAAEVIQSWRVFEDPQYNNALTHHIAQGNLEKAKSLLLKDPFVAQIDRAIEALESKKQALNHTYFDPEIGTKKFEILSNLIKGLIEIKDSCNDKDQTPDLKMLAGKALNLFKTAENKTRDSQNTRSWWSSTIQTISDSFRSGCQKLFGKFGLSVIYSTEKTVSNTQQAFCRFFTPRKQDLVGVEVDENNKVTPKSSAA